MTPSAPAPTSSQADRLPFRAPAWLAAFLVAVYLICLVNPLTRPFDFDVNLILALAAAFGGAVHGALRLRPGTRTPRETRDSLAAIGIANAFASLVLEGLVALAAVLVVAAATRVVLPCCGFAWGLLYFALGPVFSLAFGIAVGLLTASLARTRRRAALWAALVVGVTAIYPAIRALFVPVAFAYNPAFGYFPGPVYDPVVGVEPAYLWARLLTVAIIATLLAGLDLWSRAIDHDRPPRPRTGSSLTLAWAVPTAVALGILGDRVGISSGFSAIDRELNGSGRTAHFVVHYPAEGQTARHIRWVRADLEATYASVSSYLETHIRGPIDVYIYPSREAKKRLMGAGRTSMAFPRSRSLHLNADRYPHPVLRHELAHVLSGPRGMPFIGVSPLPGLTEGLAVAAEETVGSWTVHEWAAAMKRIGKLPDVRRVLTVTGFWQHPGGIAYTACGSFVRYLIDSRGIDRFWTAYRWGRLASSYDTTLDALVDAWEHYLDGVEVSEEALTQARYRFSRRGLFNTPCVRAKQRLRARADDLFVHGRPRAAATMYQEAAQTAGGDPRLRRAAMRSWLTAESCETARDLGEQLLGETGDAGTLAKVPVEVMLGSAYYRLGDTRHASQYWDEAARAGVSTPDVRLALCLTEAVKAPRRLGPVLDYLARSSRSGSDLLRLAQAVQSAPNDPIVSYLLARRLQTAELWDQAAARYREALDAGLPHPFLTREALRNRAVCALFSGDPDQAEAAIRVLRTDPASTRADRILAQRLSERLDWVSDNRPGTAPQK